MQTKHGANYRAQLTDLLMSDMGREGYATERHREAVVGPHRIEAAYLQMLRGLAAYAEEHERQLGSPIGQDGYAGEYWSDIASALIKLLSNERGRLDGGACDHAIRELAKRVGFTSDEADQL